MSILKRWSAAGAGVVFLRFEACPISAKIKERSFDSFSGVFLFFVYFNRDRIGAFYNACVLNTPPLA